MSINSALPIFASLCSSNFSVTPLIPASESPRRRELLKEAGFNFDVVPVKVSEIPNKNLNVNDQILDIARRKARAAFEFLRNSREGDFRVLSADTEVIFGNAPLGKPSRCRGRSSYFTTVVGAIS